MAVNISKFSWAELFSNDNGKTSGTAFCGIVICLSGTFCFVLGCIDKMFLTSSIDIITQSILFVGIGAGLLGVRKVVGSKSSSESTPEPSEPSEPSSDEMINS